MTLSGSDLHETSPGALKERSGPIDSFGYSVGIASPPEDASAHLPVTPPCKCREANELRAASPRSRCSRGSLKTSRLFQKPKLKPALTISPAVRVRIVAY